MLFTEWHWDEAGTDFPGVKTVRGYRRSVPVPLGICAETIFGYSKKALSKPGF
jgi:hypothetical protein